MKLYLEDNETIPAVQVLEDSAEAPIGYTQTDTIEAWYKYGRKAADYKAVRSEIIRIRESSGGYPGCTADEKKILEYFMASGIGTEFNDFTYWTEEEHRANMIAFDKGMRDSRVSRDEAVSWLLQEKIRKGQFSILDIEIVMLDCKQERERYRVDGHEGLQYGDSKEGYFDYLENTNKFGGLTVVAVNKPSKKITVQGDHVKAFISREFLKKGALVIDSILWRDSTGNDGVYTINDISDIVKNGSNTDITVNEDIPDDVTLDGMIYHCGLMSFNFASDILKNDIMKIYTQGIY